MIMTIMPYLIQPLPPPPTTTISAAANHITSNDNTSPLLTCLEPHVLLRRHHIRIHWNPGTLKGILPLITLLPPLLLLLLPWISVLRQSPMVFRTIPATRSTERITEDWVGSLLLNFRVIQIFLISYQHISNRTFEFLGSYRTPPLFLDISYICLLL